jgi:hypothetical protein
MLSGNFAEMTTSTPFRDLLHAANLRRKTAQNSIEVDAKSKESTRKTKEKLDGRKKEGHERKKPK